jgi:hypothetical protein
MGKGDLDQEREEKERRETNKASRECRESYTWRQCYQRGFFKPHTIRLADDSREVKRSPIFTAARGKTGYWLMMGCSGGATEPGEGV